MLGQWFLVDADPAKLITIGAGDYFVQNPLKEESISAWAALFPCVTLFSIVSCKACQHPDGRKQYLNSAVRSVIFEYRKITLTL